MIRITPFLRLVLLLDAVASGLMAILLCAAPGWLAGLTVLPQPLLVSAGIFLVGYAAFVGWMSKLQTAPAALLLLVIVGNGLWAVGSLALLFSGLIAPNALGMTFVAVQAVLVGGFSELQFIGMRRARQQLA